MARRTQTSGNGALTWLIMLVVLMPVVAYVVRAIGQVAVSSAVLAFPFVALFGLLLRIRISRAVPALMDPVHFDSRAADALVLELLNTRAKWVATRIKQYQLGQEEGQRLTKGSDRTRFRASSRGDVLNQALDDADIAVAEAEAEIAAVRRRVGSELPAWREEFDGWVWSRSVGLAWQLSVILLLALSFLLYFVAPEWRRSTRPVQELLFWNPWPQQNLGPIIVGVLASYVVWTVAFLAHRRVLNGRIDISRASGWLFLEDKWSAETLIGDYFDIPPGNDPRAERCSASAAHPADEAWWSVLGVEPNASIEEVSTAYRLKMKEYHPDRVAHLGKKFHEVADAETRRINDAYSEAKARR